MQMGCGRGDVGSVFPITIKDSPPPRFASRSAVSGRKRASTKISWREYQSAPGVFPSVVLFASEETVLFHPMEGASSLLLCVCVSVYLDSAAPLTARTLNKCHPMPHTDTPVQLPQIPAAAHVSVRLSWLIRPS